MDIEEPEYILRFMDIKKGDTLKKLGDILARVKPNKSGKEPKPAEQTTETKYKECRIVDNVEAVSFQIFFHSFPNPSVRAYLKRHGFTWSAEYQCWSCSRYSAKTMFHAEKAIDKMKKSKSKNNLSESKNIQQTHHHPVSQLRS